MMKRKSRVAGLPAEFRLRRAGMWMAAIGAALVATAAGAHAAGREDRAYTIGNYPVEARAANAVAAKDKAIGDGQQAAFRSLLKRIVPVTAYNRLSKLKTVKAADYIDGVSVRSERNSSTEYIASYDFVFQAESVRRLLDQESIPFLDRQAPPITLVPIYHGSAGRGDAVEDARSSDVWLYAWKGLDLANSLTPVVLKASAKELRSETVKALAAGDGAALRALSGEHKTETLVVAVLEPDAAKKRARVLLVGRDAVAGFSLVRNYRIDNGDLNYTAELAAVVSLGVLEGRWKAINVRTSAAAPSVDFARRPTAQPMPSSSGPASPRPQPAAQTDGVVRFAIEFRSMAEWQDISRKISGTPNVSELDVEGLSGRGARVSLRYPGGTQALAQALSIQGLDLRNSGGGWLLTQR